VSDSHEQKLAACREKIDAIDSRILGLMGERLAVAGEIAAIKASLSEPAYYRPEREARVLRRLCELKPDSMSDRDVESLFREIMSITRGSEAELSVSVLGPEGTHSEAAALRHFGSRIRIHHLSTIDEVFHRSETGGTDFALVPVENSTEGGVSATLDRLAATPLRVCAETYLPIHHRLLSAANSLSDVRRVLALPQALGQCRCWLAENLPAADWLPCDSSAEGVLQAAGDPSLAVIGGNGAAETGGLAVLAENIGDESGIITRFLVLAHRDPPPSGDDKTSLLISVGNRPGALRQLLKPLVDQGVDMARIESRPVSGGREAFFFIDLHGHAADPVVATAMNAMREQAGMFRHLGSYAAAL
jgi:chorismate mutase/prephenate dehydratase